MIRQLEEYGLNTYLDKLKKSCREVLDVESRASQLPMSWEKQTGMYALSLLEVECEKQNKTVVDIILSMKPEQTDYAQFNIERKEFMQFIVNSIKPNGFHCRTMRHSIGDNVVAVMFRIFRNSDFPCIQHPEYLERRKGYVPCPSCLTPLTIGDFHPEK